MSGREKGDFDKKDEYLLQKDQSHVYIRQKSHYFLSFLIFITIFSYYSDLFDYLYFVKSISFPPYIIPFSLLSVISTIIVLKDFNRIKIHPIIISSFIMSSLEIIGFIFYSQNNSGIDLLFLEIYFLFLVMFIFFILGSSSSAIMSARRAVLICSIITVILGFYELFHPFAFLPAEWANPGRISVFYINPNRCGIALVLALVICTEVIPMKLRSLFVLFVLLGIIITFSRSAIFAGFFIIFLMLYFNIIKKKQFMLFSIFGLIIAIALISIILKNLLSVRGLNIENIVGRLDWFTSLGQYHDFSSQERFDLAKEALDSIGNNPFKGIGISGKILWNPRPHNMYLAFAVQYGVIGFFLYPIYLLTTVSVGFSSNRWMFISFILVMLFFGFFSHNLMQEYYVLISYGLIAAVGLQDIGNRKPSKQDSIITPSKTPYST